MAKRLSVTIAGAVSLGSYEAGVLWEVLDGIERRNAAAKSDDDKIIIDVITGASAGGMTAVILAQKLLYCGGEFKSSRDNPLYNTWVNGISLEELQKTGDDEPALQSVFSSNLISRISNQTVMARYDATSPQPAVAHVAVGDRLSVGLALTNLNGLAYTHKVTPGGSFTYIDYSDQLTRRINAADCDKPEFWEPLRAAAVACGAFPIAFRPQPILRSKDLDKDDYKSTTLAWDGEPDIFTYSDGGMLQNQPLGMAKNLVDRIDEHTATQRFYLFVSPHAKDPETTPFPAGSADYFHLVKRLIGVVAGQAGFRDWITASGVNDRISKLDGRARGLRDAMLGGAIATGSLQEVSTELLRLFFPGGKHCPPGGMLETLEQAQTRIATQYAEEMTQLAGAPGRPEAFRDAVLAFESAAELGARDFMTIYGVTATDRELASTGLQSFLGFFDVKYREHDYQVGRQHARAIFSDKQLDASDQIGRLTFDDTDAPSPDAKYNGSQLHDLPDADKNLFKSGMKKRIDAMIKDTPHHLFGEAFVADRIVDVLIDFLTKPVNAEPPAGPPS